MRNLLLLAATMAVAVLAVSTAGQANGVRANADPPFATGLNNPRGLTFGPGGQLYVAEAGDASQDTMRTDNGTPDPSDDLCAQVGNAGPYTGGNSSRISRIDPAEPNHPLHPVVSGLPSSATSPDAGSLVSGVGDVKFLDGQLYGIESGAGCSHGLQGTHNSLFRVVRIHNTTTTAEVADLSAFQMHHPVAFPNCCDFEPDGTWYSMVAARGAIYAVEPNHGEVDRITPQGHITRVVDTSAIVGHVVPTSLSSHDGRLYFGNLGTFPIVPGHDLIWKVTDDGNLKVVADNLTTVLGTAWDSRGRLYALESTPVFGFPGADPSGAGKVVRIDANDKQTTVVSGLTTPSAMTFGPGGALYISNFGFGAPAGAGEILRVEVP